MSTSTKIEEQEAIEMIADFKPNFTDKTKIELERVASGNIIGLNRRLALLACARSADILSQLSIEHPEAYTEMINGIELFKEHVQDLSELAEAACFRIKIADCRERKNEKTKVH